MSDKSHVKTNPTQELDQKLPIMAHLEDLRKCLWRCAVAVVITTAASFYFARYVFDLLESRVGSDTQFIFVDMTEMIGTYFMVAMTMGIVLAMPFIIFQVVLFIRPALTRKEKKYVYLLIPALLLSFVAGVVFGYFVLIPPGAKFLIGFGNDIAEPNIRISNFISVMTKLLFVIGLCFETPIVILFLSKIGVVSPEGLSKFRKWEIVGAFILAAMITPTFDPLNQSLVAIPLIILYEFGILLARIFRNKEKVPVPQKKQVSLGCIVAYNCSCFCTPFLHRERGRFVFKQPLLDIAELGELK